MIGCIRPLFWIPLRDLGLSDYMISLIMKCITISSIRVSWNGEVIDSFLPSRGI